MSTSHVYKRAPKVKLRWAQNVHWSVTKNMTKNIKCDILRYQQKYLLNFINF